MKEVATMRDKVVSREELALTMVLGLAEEAVRAVVMV